MRRSAIWLLATASLLPCAAQNQPASDSVAHQGLDRTGQVRVYDPGNTLAINIGDGREKAYDLKDRNISLRMDPRVRAGSYVSFREETTANGAKVIIVRFRGQGKR